MWNTGPNNVDIRNPMNGYTVTPTELASVQNPPPESSVYREFPTDVSNLNSNLRNGTQQLFSATNPQMGNQGMFMAHNHHPERGNIGWMNGQYSDPNYSLGMQMKGPSLVNVPYVEDHSQMLIPQNFTHSQSNFATPGRFLPYHIDSTGHIERVQPNFYLPATNSGAANVPYESNPSEFSYLDAKNTNESVFYVPAVTDVNQAHASYNYPIVDTYSNAPDSRTNGPGISEVSSETYKKACDALLAYAQMKRSANEPITQNENGNESVKAEAVRCEREPSLTMEKPSFTGASEVLWDGTLQLNASTEVLAIALFKSGEKVVDPSWAKFVDIKGKVKLEAFEKFLQELPRSRNRALMVISIHWKAGTPDSGLKGMKEVAKGYKEQQRVGYAQFSSGVDLYVCPRSDAVITILAKYGFLRGMGAVEEDQDSLIGCVVWRRSRPTTEPVDEPITEPVDRTDSSPPAVNRNPSLSTPALDMSISSLLPQLQPFTSQVDPPRSTDELHQFLSSAVRLLMQDASENAAKPPPSVKVDHVVNGQTGEEDLPEFDFGAAARAPLPAQDLPHEGHEMKKWLSGVGLMGHSSAFEAEKPRMGGLLPYFDDDDEDDDDDDDDDMPEWCPPGMEREKLTLPPGQPPPLLPSPPPISNAWAAVPPPLPFDQNQGITKQDQRGILGQFPVDLFPNIPHLQARPEARRSDHLGRRSPPELTARSRPKKQRRSSGWDIRPSEGNSSRRSHRSRRH